MIYSIFESSYLRQNDILKTKELVYEYHFYMGDFSTLEIVDDWRFKKISGKRMESKFLGIASIESFPLNYPFTLNNGKILLKIETNYIGDEI